MIKKFFFITGWITTSILAGLILANIILAINYGAGFHEIALNSDFSNYMSAQLNNQRMQRKINQGVDNENVSEIIDEINATCNNKNCKVLEASFYVDKVIEYNNSVGDELLSVEEIFEINKGDCEEQATLFSVILKNFEIESELLFQENHVCVLYQLRNDYRSWNCIEGLDVWSIS